jgi:hypothetical protein
VFDGDALIALDRRIVAVLDARASAARFSDAYWEADDTLAWLRMVRDELIRTGRLSQAAVAFLEERPAPAAFAAFAAEDTTPAGVPVMLAEREAGAGRAVVPSDDATESAESGRGSRHARAEPVAAA